MRRHKYKAAYTAYMQCVRALSEASEYGRWPDAEVLKKEEEALLELVVTRKELLAALGKRASKP